MSHSVASSLRIHVVAAVDLAAALLMHGKQSVVNGAATLRCARASQHALLAIFCLWPMLQACGESAQKSTDDNRANEQTGEGMANAVACPAERLAACDRVNAEIAALETQRSDAQLKGDADVLARTTLDLTYKLEYLRLLAAPTYSEDAMRKLASKYDELRRITESQLSARAASAPEGSTSPAAPQPGASVRLPAVVYQPRELEAVQAVFQDFGDLYITDTGLTPDGAPRTEEIKVDMPWTGYWFPMADDSLYGQDSSPLAKLDRVMARLGTTTSAAATERASRDMYPSVEWEGHCAAWAVAAASSKEPLAPVEFQGEVFEVQDQKALLTKIHEQFPNKLYGIRYNGNAETDGTIQDIRPEAFHKIVQAVLIGQKRPFVIDDDSSVEVWSKPVYRVSWSIRKDPDVANAFLVNAFPWMVQERKSFADTAPTNILDRTGPSYYYRLYVDPSDVVDGKLRVIAGEWVGSSRDTHPDSITVPTLGGDYLSGNAEINKSLDAIKQILGSNLTR